MRTILLASVATAALASSAWALPDRYEGHRGCIGGSGLGCEEQVTLADDGNRMEDKVNSAIGSAEDVAVGAAETEDVSRLTASRTIDDDEDLNDEIGDAADEIGDRAEDVGEDVADAADEVGDEISDAADDVGDEIDDAFD